MLLIDTLIEVFEKHGLNEKTISNEMAQAIASDVEDKLENFDEYSAWSNEARELLKEALENLKTYKSLVEEGSVPKIELKNLIYKIEEQLIK